MNSIRKIFALAVATVLMVACEGDLGQGGNTDRRMVKASFSLPVEGTRTAIGEDGTTTEWMPGDRIAVWAERGDGELSLAGTTFAMHHYTDSYSEAVFEANIPAMAEADYTYSMCYPLPHSISGTTASYTIPATQSGEYDGELDVMIATPVQGGALTSTHQTLKSSMHHLMHAVRIDIPTGRNIFGYRFTRLEIEFPTAVVGDISFDVTQPDAEPMYNPTSNTIVVENEGGFDEGDTIWVFVLPGTVDGDVSYKVKGSRRRSVSNTYALTREMLPGHVTPIRMATPELDKYTVFYFSVGSNLLGEDFNTFTITDHNGTQLGDVFTRNEENVYALELFGETDLSGHQNVDLTLTFDTDHAIVPVKVNTGTLVEYCEHTMTPAAIPYLFEEDFSDVPSFSDGHDNPENGFSGDSKDYNSWFSAYTTALPGWSGGRYGCEAGTSLRVCARYETALGATGTYRGRFDTSVLSLLKSNANASINVMFNYSAASNTYLTVAGSTTMSVGWTSNTSAVSGDTDIENTTTINGYVISDQSGSYTNVPSYAETVLTGCNATSRLTWQADTNADPGLTSIGNGNFWLYVDNIKVQIVPNN